MSLDAPATAALAAADIAPPLPDAGRGTSPRRDRSPRASMDDSDRRTAASFGLSPREQGVLAEIVAGRTNREIGERLFISEKTVGVHVSNILAKLGVGGRVEAATVALRRLVDDRPMTKKPDQVIRASVAGGAGTAWSIASEHGRETTSASSRPGRRRWRGPRTSSRGRRGEP
jgi:DNA-binding CsgD family transcriptional regulator